MLFNSHEFLFTFLPLVLCLHWALRRNAVAHHAVMVAASAVFYAAWDPRFLLLLWGSILINYGSGQAIASFVEGRKRRSAHVLLVGAITVNLAAIGVFKYAGFFAANLNFLAGTNFDFGTIILPLGISFFTFEQISYLVDVYNGECRSGPFLHYAFFVSFFPRLVAGPILRFKEIAPQLASAAAPPASSDLAVGLTIFFIGLAKKAIIADGIAGYATSVFTAAASGQHVDFFDAWRGALAYTFQLYFDFSGYSDMAIGIARCLGIRFPMNFFSPYKSASIKEFWTRWHMTLSRFLRDYLYIALGGNRRGTARRYLNLMVTMLLGGLWHGANWTFVIWGGLHGLYLLVNHAWLAIAANSARLTAARSSRPAHVLGVLMTFVAVVFAWVFFRAPNFATAANMVGAMLGHNGASLPAGLAFALHPIAPLLAVVGVGFVDKSGTQFVTSCLWIAALAPIVFFAPSTQEIMARWEPVLPLSGLRIVPPRHLAAWVPSRRWAIAIGIVAFLAVISTTRVSEFIYWQF